MKTRLGLFALFTCAFVLATLTQSAVATSVELRFVREGISNSITLTCRDSQSQQTIDDASFFLNGTMQVTEGQNGGVLRFTITGDREGNYTCVSENTQSDPVSIVAYPGTSIIPTPPPTYTLVGDTAQVNCALPPGALIQQYRVTWFISGQQILNSNSATDPRYRINPVNLSLIIEDVRLSDASDEYQCLYIVTDPQSSATQRYETLSRIAISLVVLDHPRITRAPAPQIVKQGARVIFNCEATGSPLPYIIWKRGDDRIFSDGERYSIETNRNDNGTVSTRSSELTLLSAEAKDSGDYTCVARVPDDEDTGVIELETAESTARLSVLGDFRDVEIRITVDRDVIFDLDLPMELEDPVHLYLLYRNTDNNEMDEKVTSATYTNLRNIRHIEFDSDVNFERFEVNVALQSGTVRGPVMSAGSYDKSVPNTPLRELIRQTPVIAISSAFVILLICCLVFTAYVVKQCIICHRRKFQNEEKRTCDDLKKVAKSTKGPLAPKKDENCDVVDGIVNEAIGHTSSKDMAGGPPPPPTFTTVKDHFRRAMSRPKGKEYDLESGQESLSGGSRAITKFAANTLFMGMKDRNHGQKFKELVRKLIDEADKVNPQENVDSNHAPPAEQNEASNGPPSYLQSISNPAYEPVGTTVTVTVHEDVDNKEDAELDGKTAV